jgi:uncharacterized protein (TIGR04255 family)
MDPRPTDLPEYNRPPVSEVVLSLQFEPLEGMKTPLIGLLWQRFREYLPEMEEHPPLPHIVEQFGAPALPRLDVVVEEKLPVPRVWFLTAEKTQLVQVQQDRFIHNWRKVTGQEPYPRYVSIREIFKEEVTKLIEFLREENVGRMKINQCEVTYVNQIEPRGFWEKFGDVSAVLRNWTDLPPGGFLPGAEDVSLRARYILPGDSGEPVGRLHVLFQPAWKKVDYSPVFTMNLTARGRPLSDDLEGAFGFLDLGHVWIVKGFADLCTETMQYKAWERIR